MTYEAARFTGWTAPGFVGREPTLDRLGRLAESAAAGVGSLALVTGEPGIGKTRLALEQARRAAVAGLEVHEGSAWEGGGAPAYWPWVQVLRSVIGAADHSAVRADLGEGASEVARLVPELGVVVGPVGDEVDDDLTRGQHRFRLFDAVNGFLRRASVRRPIMLVLDDLHWADVGSVMLLRAVGRECRRSSITVIACYRDAGIDPSDEVMRALTELERDHTTLALDGLTEDDVRRFLAQTVGPDEADGLAPEVHSRSGGNPLFVQELSQLLVRAGRRPLSAAEGIPRTVRAVIERRVSRLSESCRRVLSTAAAVGREFDLSLVALVAGEDRRMALELIDEAVTARLAAHVPESPEHFAFVNALVPEVLYGEMPLAERANLHLRIAEHLERRGGTSLGELAHHYLRAAPVIGGELGSQMSERAAWEAMQLFAYEDAAAHFARALHADGGSDERRARLWLAVGDAHDRASRNRDAVAAVANAAVLARRVGDVHLLAEAALRIGAGADGFETRLFDDAQIGLLEEALAALGPDDSALRARLLARLSVALTFSAPDDRRRRLAEQAVATARRVADDEALIVALGAHCDVSGMPDGAVQRSEESVEMVRLAIAVSGRGLELLGRRHRLVALLELGDVVGFDREARDFDRSASALRQPLYAAYTSMWKAMRALMDGRLGECRACVERAVELGDRAESTNLPILTRMVTHALCVEELRFADALEVVREEIEIAGGVWGQSVWAPLIAPSLLQHEARAVLDRLVADDFAEFPRDANWLGALVGWVVSAAVAVGHEAAAARVYEMLTPYADRFAVEGIAAICHGPVARHLGLLATMRGDHERALQHLESALAVNRRAGSSLLIAHTWRAYGDALVAAGDRRGGEAMLRQAASAYREMGLPQRADEIDAVVAAPSASVSESSSFCRDGELWTISYAGTTVHLKDTKGLRDIGALLARPGVEVHVFDLMAPDAMPRTGPLDPHDAVGSVSSFGAQPMLDDAARTAYRARLHQLREDLEEAEAFGDSERAALARDEMDILASELASSMGLGGRARGFGDPAERARKAVGQRMRNALKRIASEHPDLFRHLDASLRLGMYCSYAPDRPTTWTV